MKYFCVFSQLQFAELVRWPCFLVAILLHTLLYLIPEGSFFFSFFLFLFYFHFIFCSFFCSFFTIALFFFFLPLSSFMLATYQAPDSFPTLPKFSRPAAVILSYFLSRVLSLITFSTLHFSVSFLISHSFHPSFIITIFGGLLLACKFVIDFP